MRVLSTEELRKWRESILTPEKKGVERAISTKARPLPKASEVVDDAATMTVEKPKPSSPRQVYDRLTDQMRFAQKSREEFRAMVRFVRAKEPALIAHLTDEQAADFLEQRSQQMAEESIKRVFHKLGREKELTTYIGGVGGNSR